MLFAVLAFVFSFYAPATLFASAPSSPMRDLPSYYTVYIDSVDQPDDTALLSLLGKLTTSFSDDQCQLKSVISSIVPSPKKAAMVIVEIQSTCPTSERAIVDVWRAQKRFTVIYGISFPSVGGSN